MFTHGFIPFTGPGSPTGITPAQVRHAYGFDQVSFPGGTPADGRGTTIAIVDAYDDPTVQADLQAFDQQFGLPNPVFTKVNQTGGTAMPAADAGWAEEIALDVEWAHAVAPGANILLVEANNNSGSSLYAAVAYAARQPGVVAVSMSWGGGEYASESADDATFLTPAGHTGVVFVASSGDNGAPVSYPAASPNVLSVGGTTLSLDAQGTYRAETGWAGSGGGVSAYETQPAYQKGVVTQSTTRRTNPDVSYDSDPNTGFPVYDSYRTSSSWLQVGGTSDAAPQWAALIAIADQGRALAGKAALSNPTLLPMIYQLPAADFHDATAGSSSGSPSYTAGAGYDLVTGRGSPVVNRVVADLIGTPSPPAPAATHITATAPATATAGAGFSLTVTALDASNKKVTGYAGTVHFTSTDAAASLPADYTFTAADAGAHTFTITLKTAGSQSVTTADAATAALKATTTVSVSAAAVSSFRLTGFSSPVTAGTAGTFLVTAVDSSGNPVTGYTGTVHFTSSDPKAVLPANAAITGGKGTFTATFDTAGTESLTVTDTARPTMTGTLSGVTVNPAAATHLAFLQQPTTTAAGRAIAPAVTVTVLDRFNNVVTTDNTDLVTLLLGTSPTGTTLTGGGAVTVVHGVATFNGVSVGKAGTGDTLVARSGSLTGATSAPFNVTAPTPPAATGTVIEGFENNLNGYWATGPSYPLAYVSTAAAHDGTYGFDDVGDGDWYFRTDAAAQVRPGDTVSAWVKFAGAADGRAYFGFGTGFTGTLSVVLAPNSGELLIQNNAGFGFTNLASVGQTYAANQWYRVEIDWGTSGKVVAQLFGGNGQTLLNTVTATPGGVTPGGFAFRATGSDKYFDTVTVIRGVNTFVAAPAAVSAPTGGTPAAPGSTTGPAKTGTLGAGGGVIGVPGIGPKNQTEFRVGSSHHAAPAWSDHSPYLTEEWFVEVG
ncbi:MAG: hypothetical protein JWO38_2019 [Gemmataceae bacterium]|nr:hypothetical protein [Gemmataceae bacterium]